MTGGYGFIGSNLVKKLLEEDHEIILVDNLSTGSRDNVKDFPEDRFIDSVSRIKEIDGCDGIFHLGIPSTTTLYRKDRELISKAVQEFIEVMEYAKDKNVRVVYASSSSMYNQNKPPFREDMNIIATDFYTEVRLFFERISKIYNEFYGVESIGMRLFSVFGENEQSKKGAANLITQIRWAKEKDEEFEVYNHGNALRDFIHVSDVVDAFIKAMEVDVKYDVLNVGTGKAYTIREVVDFIGFKKAKYVDTPIKNYVNETQADIIKQKRVLGIEPKVDVKEYLSRSL